LEEVATDWVRRLLDLPEGFDGVINDTASSSTLYALAAAREVAYPASHREGLFGQPAGRVYASEHAHSSVEKAVLALGLGPDGYRTVETDATFAMRPDALEAALESDVAAGLRPVAVVPTIGTTSSTAVDPVAEVVEVAARHGLWVHVDAAYGGPAAIVPELRPLFEGGERADSIVVNPHKWLFTPVDCSILYCRRPEELRRAFSIVPEYLTSVEQGSARDLMDYGVSLGRRFRALKLWLVLRYFGREGIVLRLRHHVALAAELAGQVDASDDWTLVAPAHFSTVALRWSPPWDDPAAVDRANLEIRDRVNASGKAFVIHTVLGGRVTLRVSIGNLKTTRDHVQRAWTLLRAAAAEQSEAVATS
jgi:aromatic-L-amino-acid decarboxylase